MRDILHCDLNNFYASCECLVNSDIRDKPVAVCGSQKDRHGIVLAKNYLAKASGVATGQAIWQAKKLCPNLVVVEPHFPLYVDYSKKVRNILLQYTDLVEPFSIDESWLDVTDSKIFGTPLQIAEEIRARVLRETGLTVSIGVSFNKIFAKLGSDMKKPNAVTVITKQNFKQKVWNLPVGDLLMIGRATAKKLQDMGIKTIGQLAGLGKNFLQKKFGKNGITLHEYSNGIGHDVVQNYYQIPSPKSIGNSTTCYRDLSTNAEVKEVIATVAQSVVERMIEGGNIYAKTLYFWYKDSELHTFGKQCKLTNGSNFNEITKTAFKLFCELCDWSKNVRGLGISVSDFFEGNKQLDLFCNQIGEKKHKLDNTILQIKQKFGDQAIMQGDSLQDKRLATALCGLKTPSKKGKIDNAKT